MAALHRLLCHLAPDSHEPECHYQPHRDRKRRPRHSANCCACPPHRLTDSHQRSDKRAPDYSTTNDSRSGPNSYHRPASPYSYPSRGSHRYQRTSNTLARSCQCDSSRAGLACRDCPRNPCRSRRR